MASSHGQSYFALVAVRIGHIYEDRRARYISRRKISTAEVIDLSELFSISYVLSISISTGFSRKFGPRTLTVARRRRKIQLFHSPIIRFPARRV